MPPPDKHQQHAYWETVTQAACAAIGFDWNNAGNDKQVKGGNGILFLASDPDVYVNDNPAILQITPPPPPAPGPAIPYAGGGESTLDNMLAAIDQHVGPPGAGTYPLRLATATCLKELGWDFDRVNSWWERHRHGEFTLAKFDKLSGVKFGKGPWATLEYKAKFGMGSHRDAKPAPAPDAPAQPAAPPDGRLHWVMTGGKDPKPKDGSTLNAVKCLSEMGYAETLQFNLWTQRVEYHGAQFKDQREIPVLTLAIEKEYGSWGYTPGKEALLSGVRAVAHQSEYHPLQDYIKGIQWDGVLRLDYFGHHVYGLDPNDVLGNLSAALIPRGMVARIFKPGTRIPYIPIIRSDKQGVGKGESLKELAGDGNFAYGIQFGAFDFTKKVQERGRGKCIIEIAEIHALDAAKLSQAKALATDTSTNDRDAYARDAHDQPFTFIPVGTTNDKRFLTDLTGNRRHPVIDVRGPVNLQWIRDHRDQMLAEAYAEFVRGDFDYAVALPEIHWDAASAASAEYQVDDPYDVWVGGYLAEGAGSITGKKLLEDCRTSMGGVNYQRLAEAMRRAGWESRRVGRAKTTVWEPAE